MNCNSWMDFCKSNKISHVEKKKKNFKCENWIKTLHWNRMHKGSKDVYNCIVDFSGNFNSIHSKRGTEWKGGKAKVQK